MPKRPPVYRAVPKVVRKKDPRQAAFYGSARWKKIRRRVLARDPMCRICGRRPSSEADHLNGWEDNRLEAIQGVCTPCHASKSGRQHRARQG